MVCLEDRSKDDLLRPGLVSFLFHLTHQLFLLSEFPIKILEIFYLKTRKKPNFKQKSLRPNTVICYVFFLVVFRLST